MDTFVDIKDTKLNIELPYDKKSLYEDLSNMYYGDVFSNSPKTELERLQNRKNKLKLQRSLSLNSKKYMLKFDD